MAIKIKTGTKTAVSTADLLAEFQKEYGESVGSFGGAFVNRDRIPTGLFPLDLALAGGFPRGKCTIIYGPESSNKTNIALLAIAHHQKLWPELRCAFFDVENGFDPVWASALGVDVTKLAVIKPAFAEQLVDMVESLLFAEDCGLVVIDSLAALLTTQEFDSSAEKANVGGAGLVIGKLVRKTSHALSEAEKDGRTPSLIYINQIRMKIGVMFGNPETMPGGNAPKYQATMIMRVYAKNISDPKISTTMPVLKETNFVIGKWKVPIYSTSGQVSMVTWPHKGLRIGQADDFNTISEYLKNFGLFEKGDKGKGWVIMGEPYDTIQPFKDKCYEEGLFANDLRKGIIERVLADQTLTTAGGSVNG